jgi:hypothetical protein
MLKDGFETEIEALFSQAAPFDDDDAFVQSVTARTARLRRIERVIHTAAASIGGAIAIYELAQPGLWVGLYNWVSNSTAPLAQPQMWAMPDPMTLAAITGAGLLAAYVTYLLREA